MGIFKNSKEWFWEVQKGLWAFLDWRMAGQALPRGACPVFAFGGRVIVGQYWTHEEIREFLGTLGWDPRVCVFEYTRPVLPVRYQQENNLCL